MLLENAVSNLSDCCFLLKQFVFVKVQMLSFIQCIHAEVYLEPYGNAWLQSIIIFCFFFVVCDWNRSAHLCHKDDVQTLKRKKIT